MHDGYIIVRICTVNSAILNLFVIGVYVEPNKFIS